MLTILLHTGIQTPALDVTRAALASKIKCSPKPLPSILNLFLRHYQSAQNDREHGGHRGGAWKVAYADFVTALMALFIVLWLMNAREDVRQK